MSKPESKLKAKPSTAPSSGFSQVEVQAVHECTLMGDNGCLGRAKTAGSGYSIGLAVYGSDFLNVYNRLFLWKK